MAPTVRVQIIDPNRPEDEAVKVNSPREAGEIGGLGESSRSLDPEIETIVSEFDRYSQYLESYYGYLIDLAVEERRQELYRRQLERERRKAAFRLACFDARRALARLKHTVTPNIPEEVARLMALAAALRHPQGK